MPQKKIEYSVVIPVYNSQESLEELYRRVIKTFKSITPNYEIIMVDDCSQDQSWKFLLKLHAHDKKVKVIELLKNFGQQNAIMCGLGFARGNYIITMDDDLQHPPEEIPKLINKIQEGYDVVYGQYYKKEHNVARNFGTYLINFILKKVTRRQFNLTSFRIIKKIVVDMIVKYNNYNVMVDVCISNLASNEKVGLCLVGHNRRKFGKTNYSFSRLLSFSVSLLLNYSTLPLKVASLMGLFLSFLSFIIALALIINYFHKQVHVSGWTSLILIIIFFSGVILFVLGIIGEYISRIFLSLNNKPQFEIREAKI